MLQEHKNTSNMYRSVENTITGVLGQNFNDYLTSYVSNYMARLARTINS